MVALKSDGWSCNNAITQSVKLGSDSVPEGSRGERGREGQTDGHMIHSTTCAQGLGGSQVEPPLSLCPGAQLYSAMTAEGLSSWTEFDIAIA